MMTMLKKIFGAGKRAPEPVETLDAVSADLPYELQSKMFDQLATFGVAGAGLTVTLIGSVLSEAPFYIWFAAIAFATAAIMALSGQSKLIEALFLRAPTRKQSKRVAGLAIALLGFGIGMLASAISTEARSDHKHDNPAGLADGEMTRRIRH